MTQVLVNQSVDKAVVKYPWRIARDQVQVNVLDGASVKAEVPRLLRHIPLPIQEIREVS